MLPPTYPLAKIANRVISVVLGINLGTKAWGPSPRLAIIVETQKAVDENAITAADDTRVARTAGRHLFAPCPTLVVLHTAVV